MRAGLRALQPGEADAFIYASDAMIVSQQELLLDTSRAKKLDDARVPGQRLQGTAGELW